MASGGGADAEANLPIDIYYNKLTGWLVKRMNSERAKMKRVEKITSKTQSADHPRRRRSE